MKDKIIEEKQKETENSNSMSNKAKYISYIMLGLILLFGIVIMIIFLIYQKEALIEIYRYKNFVKNNISLSLFLLAVSHTIASILFIPGSVFGLSTGIIFGTIFNEDGLFKYLGYFICVFTFLLFQGIAGLVVYKISSYFFRKKIREEFISKSEKLRKLDRVIDMYGAKALFLFRLSPIIPITIFNYLLGGFNISSMDFIISSFGSFPGELFYCYIGYTAVNIDEMLEDKNKSMIMILMTILGGIILIVLIFVFAKISQRQFDNLAEEETGTGRQDNSNTNSDSNIISNSDNTKIELQKKSQDNKI